MRSSLFALVLLAGCGGDPCEPVYDGGGTDEAWRALVDAPEVVVGDASAPVFTSGATLTTDAVISWSSPIAVLEPPARGALATALAWIEALFIGTAHAHLPPITGDVYMLELEVEGEDCRYTVVTTELEWQLDDAAWELVQDAGTVTLHLTSAYLRENRISEGPFGATPVTVTVAP